MQINAKGAAVLVVGVAGLMAGAYTLGMRQAGEGGGAPAAQPGMPAPEAAAGPLNGRTDVPGNHPPINQGGSPGASSGAGPLATPSPGADAAPVSGADPDAKFTHFRVGNRNVKSIYADGELMWVGTSGGVIRYNIATDEYKRYSTQNGLLSNGVFYVGKLGDEIMVGTYGGGLSILDPATEQWRNYNVPQGLGDAFVYEVMQAKNGDIWIATWSGANRIRGGNLDDRTAWETFTVANTEGGLPNDWVYGLDEGADGTIWLGTEGGLARFRDGQWQNWQHADGLGADFEQVKDDAQFNNDPGQASSHHARQKSEQGLEDVSVAYNPNYIISMVVDGEGNVWSGTWGAGLARFDGESWHNFTVSDGLPSNHIFMLTIDADGVLWIGTSGGLVKYLGEGEGFKTYTAADGLFSNNVFSYARGEDGSHWVGSFGGVAKLTELP